MVERAFNVSFCIQNKRGRTNKKHNHDRGKGTRRIQAKLTQLSSMVTLSPETVDDLIYSARVGDLEALRTDIAQLSETNKCSPAEVICGAIDAEPESEGGSGSCLLHFPAANGNLGG